MKVHTLYETISKHVGKLRLEKQNMEREVSRMKQINKAVLDKQEWNEQYLRTLKITLCEMKKAFHRLKQYVIDKGKQFDRELASVQDTVQETIQVSHKNTFDGSHIVSYAVLYVGCLESLCSDLAFDTFEETFEILSKTDA